MPLLLLMTAFCVGLTMALGWAIVGGSMIGSLAVYVLGGNIAMTAVLAPHLRRFIR
ncbi:MAG: hypothetical protein P8N14_02210 [Sulfitobacter sp.]|jgi:hypothetical protein|nr:hypothetical protein [Sulfitobacter sp.]